MYRSRKTLAASAATGIIAFALLSGGAHAQEAAGGEVEELVVTGFRGSLAAARELKRSAEVTSDVIVAEDMAKFPD
ncbi:hypothetical protein, partial [Phenylobacterium sp.]|uniref:hypothetical protein n=1 Tax=Phenylobacterium sp. TaxID=1871053 RepID=UPI0025F88F58